MATNDGEYNGYHIPKGTLVIGNAWSVQILTLILFSVLMSSLRSILHDPKVFNDPMEFQPERYLKDGQLNPDVRDPDCAAFGFGRRSVDSYRVLQYTCS
jgi:Cytochrome P450